MEELQQMAVRLATKETNFIALGWTCPPPYYDFTMGHTVKRGLFSGSTLQDVMRETSRPILAHIAHSLQCTPWLSSTLAADTLTTCCTLKIFTTVWDKQPNKVGGFCASLISKGLLDNILCSPKFTIWGYGGSRDSADRHVVSVLLHRARVAGVIQDVVALNQCPLKFLLATDTASLWDKNPNEQPSSRAPSAFVLPKWKTQEHISLDLKMRVVISYKHHPIRRWSRLMGRSLQLMVRDLYEHEVGIGRCTMLGVRDLCRMSQRCSKGGLH